MNDHPIDAGAQPADDIWLRDWAQAGITALEAHLAKHASFAAFLCQRRLGDSDHRGGVAHN